MIYNPDSLLIEHSPLRENDGRSKWHESYQSYAPMRFSIWLKLVEIINYQKETVTYSPKIQIDENNLR